MSSSLQIITEIQHFLEKIRRQNTNEESNKTKRYPACLLASAASLNPFPSPLPVYTQNLRFHFPRKNRYKIEINDSFISFLHRQYLHKFNLCFQAK